MWYTLRELEDICDNLGLLHKGGILFESDIDSVAKEATDWETL